MVRNEQRRQDLADAGLAILAREGSRGLTHRAVDELAGTPKGTASNYFRSRDALILGLTVRIGERLAPDPLVVAELAAQPPGRELFGRYLAHVVDRLLANREVTLALFELRLEAARRPDLAPLLAEWQRGWFDADVDFNARAGLPGGRRQIALFHYAIDGLVLDRLTTSIDPGTPVAEAVTALVDGLLGP